jgi:hypothetical protein
MRFKFLKINSYFAYFIWYVIFSISLCEISTYFLNSQIDAANQIEDLKKISLKNSLPENDKKPWFVPDLFFGYKYNREITPRYYIDNHPGDYKYPLSQADYENILSHLFINNYGFISDTNYPYEPKNGELIVGVFGGSVANFFTMLSSKEFESNLKNLLNKNVRVLNFSLGASKQPQQAAILNYFTSIGQKFDYVISIDGVNELSVPPRNLPSNISGNYPFTGVIGNFSVGANINPGLAIYAIQQNDFQSKVKKLSDFYSTIKWLNSNTVEFLTVIYYKHLTNQFNSSKQNFSNIKKSNELDPNLLQFPQAEKFTSLSETINFFIKNQTNASFNMSLIAQGNGAKFIQVLQPNQYYSKKHFSESEKNIAIWNSKDNILIQTIPTGYPILRKSYQQRNNFLDLSPIFDQEETIIYVDNCCHFNKYGNDIMAKNIAEYLGKP